MDYNATTPIRREVQELMERVCRECYGNPSSVHILGRMSKACIEDARRKVADALGADAQEIIFTSGGSESDNLAIKGAAQLHKGGHVISACIEHSAVSQSCDWLVKNGYSVTCLAVDRDGYVNPKDVEAAIQDDTFLITIMWANNETGQIQPVDEIAQIARDNKILFHTDAVQAFGKIPVNVRACPVDMLAISGHKLYAPKGIGALYVRAGTEIASEVHGGGQEMGYRSGTQNTPGIAALGEACRLVVIDMEEQSKRQGELRDKLEAAILDSVPDCIINGCRERRVPNTLNISFRGVEANQLIVKLDEYGIAASGASACHSGKNMPSRVLTAGMGLTEEEALGAVRFSLGRDSEAAHIDALIKVLPTLVEQLRTSASRS